MAGKFTDEQQAVVNAKISNLLCSAAAGSGKTSVLVERIINQTTGLGEKAPDRLIDIDRILVVTFTRNAAATMKERLVNKLNELSVKYPDNKRIISQRNKIAYADILTLDAFCSKVVRNYCYASKIEPGFRMADTAEAQIIKKDAIKAVMLKYYEVEDAQFLDFISRYASKNDDDIVDIINTILSKAESALDEEEFIANLTKNYCFSSQEEFLASDLCDLFYKYCIDELNSALYKAYDLKGLCDNEGEVVLSDQIDQDISSIKAIMKDNFTSLVGAFEIASFGNTSLKQAISPDFGNTYKELREAYKGSKGILGTLKNNLKKYSIDKLIAYNQDLMPLLKKLSELTLEVKAEINRVKASRNLYSFSDIAHEAYRIINENQAIREELRDSYDQIMVDEYQDSNYIQEEIVQAISGKELGQPNIFMVGDVKQSIYKFRQAKPKLIVEKQETYEEVEGADNRLIKLNRNFRSANKVINFINYVFDKIMVKDTVSFDYKGQELYLGAKYGDYELSDEGLNELILLDTSDCKKDEINDVMCSQIASVIDSIVGKQDIVYTEGEEVLRRKASYKDVCVIASTGKGIVPALCTYLPDHGIPAMANTSTGYFNTSEISYIINYLSIIDNPYRDIEFVAVLKAYPQNLSDDELAKLKIFERANTDTEKLYYIDICKKYIASCEDELSDKLRDFFADYKRLSDLSKVLNVSDLIKEIYKVTGFYNYALMMPSGQLRIANLDMLYVKAKAFEENNSSEIGSFVRYVDTLKKYKIEQGEATSISGADYVNIMTIHGSKGMEFPYVLLVDLSKNFNEEELKDTAIVDDEFGFGINYVDKGLNIKTDTLQRFLVKKNILREDLAEQIRVLYVALTRAKQKLYMFGKYSSSDDLAKLAHKGNGDSLFPADVLSAKNYFELIIPAIFNDDIFSDFDFTGSVMIGDFLKVTRVKGATKLENNQVISKAKVDFTSLEEIERYFNFDYYENHNREAVPVKYSVSELKHEAIEQYELDHDSLYKPMFVSEKKEHVPRFIEKTEDQVNIGALKGTLTHLFMEHIVQTDLVEEKDLLEYLNNKINDGIFSEDMVKYINLGKVSTFLKSDVCQAMRAARDRRDLYLEQPFVYGIPACELLPGQFESDELVIIQGIIDVFYVEDDEFVILDYKTDKVDLETGEEKLKGYYERQLRLYSQAVSKVFGKKLKSLLIYSFGLEKIIEI